MGRRPGRTEACGVVRGAGTRRPTSHGGASMRSHWIARLTAIPLAAAPVSVDIRAAGPATAATFTRPAIAAPRVQAAGDNNSGGWAER